MASKLSSGIASFEKPLHYLYNKQLKKYIIYSGTLNVELCPKLLLIMHHKHHWFAKNGKKTDQENIHLPSLLCCDRFFL
jgi:hypothetical protein